MATVSVRYFVYDVDAAIGFYRDLLGFTEQMHPSPAFAMMTRADLRLVLSASGGGPGGGQAMTDGSLPEPGGWNRFSIEVDDLAVTVASLRAAGARFRNDIVTGVGGRQIVVDDPSGNPVELFEPVLDEARLGRAPDHGKASTGYHVAPIGWVESALLEVDDAPNQGGQGAPDAWLVLSRGFHEGIRDITVGTDLFVITWLHLARRDELTTVPGDDPAGPERGVFSTRSPHRPNPVGLHRVSVLRRDEGRLRVGPLEAVDGTPILDIKPVIRTDRG